MAVPEAMMRCVRKRFMRGHFSWGLRVEKQLLRTVKYRQVGLR